MGRRKPHAREYPFIPRSFLIEHHNRWVDRQPHAWRKIAIDARQTRDVNNYDNLEDTRYSLDWNWVLEQRILHLEMRQDMARKKSTTPIVKKSTDLAEPFGSAPRFPAKYEVKFEYRGKMNIHLFAAEYSAWHFIKAVCRNSPVIWLTPHSILVGDDVQITSRHLELLYEYSPSAAERDWVLPIPYAYFAHAIATGDPWDQRTRSRHDPQATDAQAPTGRSSRSSRRKKHNTDASDAKSTSPKRSKRSDGTTFGIPELIDATGKDGGRVRAALRKLGIDKPDAGWVWPLAEKTRIEALVKKFLK